MNWWRQGTAVSRKLQAERALLEHGVMNTSFSYNQVTLTAVHILVLHCVIDHRSYRMV
jgi:hypothetical protein